MPRVSQSEPERDRVEQDEHEQNDEQQAEQAHRLIAPVARIGICRDGPEQQNEKHDQDHQSHKSPEPFLRPRPLAGEMSKWSADRSPARVLDISRLLWI